jgi:hypothetical protein
MFGRKRKKEENDIGLPAADSPTLAAPTVVPSATVTVSANPTPGPAAPPSPGDPGYVGPGFAAAPAPAAPGAPAASAPAAGAPAAGAPLTPGAIPTNSAAMLAQILSGHGPVGQLVAQIKADPQGFRNRIIAQVQAAGGSTVVMTPQGFQSLAITGGAAPTHVDVVDELTKAADLHDKGVLNDAEFEAMKKKLLSQ